jgi:hypothetical protein
MDISNLSENPPGNLFIPTVFLTPEDVEKEVRARAENLFQNRELLENIVEHHEETIRTRWDNKSNTQRKEILLEVWPGMCSEHQPGVEALRKSSTSHSNETYNWLYNNLEDLVETKALLLMLHYRGRYQPHEFVRSDLEQAALGEASGANMPSFLDEYMMLFADRRTVNTYGKLVSWDDDENAFENMTNGIAMHPGHGLQALETQERIWAFLVKCCQILLQDIPSLTESTVLPNIEQFVNQDRDATPAQTISFETSYRIPTHLDFVHLKALAYAECNQREGPSIALRRDSGCSGEMMQEQSEDRPKMLLDISRREHSSPRDSERAIFWNRVIGSIVIQGYFGSAAFGDGMKHSNRLACIHGRSEAILTPEEDLPTGMPSALDHLGFLSDTTKTGSVDFPKIELFASSPLRQPYEHEPGHPKSTMIRSGYCLPHHGYQIRRPMLLSDILLQDQQLLSVSLRTVADEVEHLTRADPTVPVLLTSQFASCLPSLLVMLRCLDERRHFQQSARDIEEGMNFKKDEPESQYSETFEGWPLIMDTTFKDSYANNYAEVTVLNRPSIESKTCGNITQALKAETPTSTPQEPTEHAGTLAVNKHVHEVFKAPFSVPFDSNQPKEVPWTDFMYTMETMGSLIEKLHGIARSFALKSDSFADCILVTTFYFFGQGGVGGDGRRGPMGESVACIKWHEV